MADASFTIDAKLDSKPFLRGSKELLNAIQSLKKTTAEAGKNMGASSESYVTAMRNGLQASKQVNEQMQRLEAEANRLRESLRAAGEQRIATEEYAKLTKDIEKVSTEMDNLRLKRQKLIALKEPDSSRTMRTLMYDLEQATNKYVKLTAEKEKLDMFMDNSVAGSSTEEYLQMSKALGEVEAKYAELAKIRDEAFGSLPQNKWQEYGMIIAHAFQTASGAVRSFISAAGGIIGTVLNAIKQVASSAWQAAVNLGKMVGGRVISALKSLAIGAKNAAVHLAKLAGHALLNGIKKVGSYAANAAKHVLLLGKNAKKSGAGFNLSFKNILRYGLGIRSLFVLFNRLRGAITESIGNMAKIDKPTNRAISSMITALNQLKNSLGSAFQPIVTAVAPYVTQLMNLLSAAITKIAEFFAILTGQTYVLKATAVQTDYAKSLDKTKKSSAGATKELKKQLAAFDQLNILSDTSSSGGGGGGADTEVDPSKMFEKIPVKSLITDFMKELREAIDSGDFTRVGTLIASKLNQAFAKVKELISWENISDTVTPYIDKIVDAFNALIDPKTGINFNLIGETLGEGINTIVAVFNRLTEGIHWGDIGIAVASGLNGVFRRIDFEFVGELLAGRMNGITDALYNFFATIKWHEITLNFVSGLNNMIRRIRWGFIGKMLAEGLESAMEVMKTAVTNFKWGDTGLKFATMLNNFFRNEHLWEDAGRAVNNAILGLADFGNKFLNQFNATQVAIDIKKALKQIKWREIADSVWDTAKLAFRKAGNFLNVLFDSDIDYDKLNNAATDVNSAIYEKMLAKNGTKANSLAYNIGKTISKAIGSIDWKAFASFLKTGATKLFNAFKDFFMGIAEDGTLQKAVEDFFGSIKWSEVADKILGLANTAFTNLGEALAKLIKQGLGILPKEEQPVANGTGKTTTQTSGGKKSTGKQSSSTKVPLKVNESENLIGRTGKALANSVYAVADWAFDAVGASDKLRQTLSDSVGGIMQGAFMFVDNAGKAGKALSDGVNAVADWAFEKLGSDSKTGKTLGDSLSGLIQGAVEFIAPKSKETGLPSAHALKEAGYYNGDLKEYEKWWKDANFLNGGIDNVIKSLTSDVDGGLLWKKLFNVDNSVKSEAKKQFEEVLSIPMPMPENFSAKDTEKELSVVEKAWTGFTNVVSNNSNVVKKAITSSLVSTIPTAVKAVQKLKTGATEPVKTVAKSVADSAGKAVNAVSGFVLKIGEGIKTIASTGTTNTNNIFGLSDSVLNEWAQSYEKSVDSTKAAQKEVSNSTSAMNSTIKNETKSASASATSNIGSMAKGITSSTKSASKSATTNMGSMAKGVSSSTKSAATSTKTNMSAMSNSANTESKKAETNTTSNFTLLSKSVGDNTKKAEQSTTTSFASMAVATALSTGLTRHTVSDAFAAIQKAVTTDSQGAAQSESKSFSQIQSDTTSKTKATQNVVSRGFSSIASSIVNNLKSARSSATNLSWSTIGVGIINGIQSGISNGWSVLRTTIQNLAKSALNTAKRILGIRSPSRVFRDEVGTMISLGIGEGIEEAEPQVMDTIASMADAISNGMVFEDPAVDIGVAGTDMLDGIDGVLTTFSDKVQNSFVGLVGALNDIVTSASFRTPNIATGTIMPYTVQAAAGSDSEPLTQAIEASNDDLANVIMQVVNNATSAIVSAIQRSTNNSGQQLSVDAIIDEINRRTRAQGHSPILS